MALGIEPELLATEVPLLTALPKEPLDPISRDTLGDSCTFLTGKVKLVESPGEGRVLVAQEAIEPGEVVLISAAELLVAHPDLMDAEELGLMSPLLLATYQEVSRICEDTTSTHGPEIYWSALAALLSTEGFQAGPLSWELPAPVTPEVQHRLLMLFHPSSMSSKCPGRNAEGEDTAVAEIIERLGLQICPKKLEELAMVFKYNAFMQAGGCLGLFFASSFCNHACAPNCLWSCNDEDLFVLEVGERGLQAGEQLSISYLTNASLLCPVLERRQELAHSWLFFCRCARCTREGEVPLCCSCGHSTDIFVSSTEESPYGDCNINCDSCGKVDVACSDAYLFHCPTCEVDICPACAYAESTH